MKWVCDECYSIMNETEKNENLYLVHCPECGNEYYVDSDDQLVVE